MHCSYSEGMKWKNWGRVKVEIWMKEREVVVAWKGKAMKGRRRVRVVSTDSDSDSDSALSVWKG